MDRLIHYVSRTSRLKPVIESDIDLLVKIQTAFEEAYKQSPSYDPSLLPEGLKHLGFGDTHAVISLEKTIVDPTNGTEIPLALKLNILHPIHSHGEFSRHIGGFIKGLESGDDLPYFIGCVTAETKIGDKSTDRVTGMLTEDVTNGKKLKTEENYGSPYCTVFQEDGSIRRVLIDPVPDPTANGWEKFYHTETRINIIAELK